MISVEANCVIGLIWLTSMAAQARLASQIVLNVRSYERDGDHVRVILKSGETIVVRQTDFNEPWTKTIEKASSDQEAQKSAEASSSPPSDAAARPLIEAKCRQEWKADFRMQEYCQDEQYQALQVLRSRSMQGSTLAGIRDKCAGEWKDDFRMRDYCEQEQLKALEHLRGR